MENSFSLIIILSCLSIVSGARILAILGTDLNSHFRVFSGLIEHIAPYHEITVYIDSNFKYKNPENVQVQHIYAPSKTDEINMEQLFANPCNIDSYSLFYNHILIVNETYIESMLASHVVSQLMKTNNTYDLLIVSGYGTEQFYQFSHKFNIPLVQVTPSQLLPWNNKAVNNPYSWINDFSFMISESTDNFFGRLKKFVKNASIVYHYYWGYLPAINSATKKIFPHGTPTVEKVNEGTELIFVNTHNILGYTRPNVPTVVEIGGLHIKPSKSLPPDLEDFINSAEDHGFIYFSLGSLVKESLLNENIRKSILNVFRKLPQKILWKWDGNMPDAPSNVKIMKWLPQGDLLAHTKIKLFISQGGMLSTQEAVYHGVPLLIIPVLFDQYNNAYLIEQRGSGKSLSLCDFTEQLFEKYINDLIKNTTYLKTAKFMSKSMKHHNQDLPERVNWWIDFVIENKGTSMLRPVIQYSLWTDIPLDILVFFICMFYLTSYLILYLIVYFYKYFNSNHVKYKIKIS